MIPSACPDGKAVDLSTARAVDGLGRWLSALAPHVTRPIPIRLRARNAAVRAFRQTSAVRIPRKATTRRALGPNSAETPFQNDTHPG